MKAWRIHAPNDVKLDELPPAVVGEGCVKIKVMSSAISLTDAFILKGDITVPYPLILGRQGMGLVSETGVSVANVVRGDRVVANPFIGCQTCQQCRQGKAYDCEKLITVGYGDDGYLRDFAVAAASDLHVLPDRVKDSDAVFLEHIAVAVNIISKLNLEKGEHVVIAGASVIGIILAQVAMYYQGVPILVDMRQDRLDIATALGIYYTVNPVNVDPFKKIFSITGGRMAETGAYMASADLPLQRSLDYIARNGRICVCGWNNVKYDLSANLNTVLSKQLSLYGVNGCAKNFPTAINMLANKTVNVTPLISKEVEFAQVGETLKEIVEFPNKYIKVVVKI